METLENKCKFCESDMEYIGTHPKNGNHFEYFRCMGCGEIEEWEVVGREDNACLLFLL
jgi:flavoprotein